MMLIARHHWLQFQPRSFERGNKADEAIAALVHVASIELRSFERGNAG